MSNQGPIPGMNPVDPAAVHTILLVLLGVAGVGVAVAVVGVVALWRVFTKAGVPGWACLLPFYNVHVLLWITFRSPAWQLLSVVPVFAPLLLLTDPGWSLAHPVGLLVLLALSILSGGTVTVVTGTGLAAMFGRSRLFGVLALGLVPIVGYCVLGFGHASYLHPSEERSVGPEPVRP